jgi:hypothetical protein
MLTSPNWHARLRARIWVGSPSRSFSASQRSPALHKSRIR